MSFAKRLLSGLMGHAAAPRVEAYQHAVPLQALSDSLQGVLIHDRPLTTKEMAATLDLLSQNLKFGLQIPNPHNPPRGEEFPAQLILSMNHLCAELPSAEGDTALLNKNALVDLKRGLQLFNLAADNLEKQMAFAYTGPTVVSLAAVKKDIAAQEEEDLAAIFGMELPEPGFAFPEPVEQLSPEQLSEKAAQLRTFYQQALDRLAPLLPTEKHTPGHSEDNIPPFLGTGDPGNDWFI